MSESSLPAELVPFAAVIYLAWADGSLGVEEMRAVQERMHGLSALDERTRATLSDWLTPERPPSPAQLRTLLDAVHEAAPQLRAQARDSLAQLGAEMARVRSGNGGRDAGIREALEEIEAALGMASGEAARALLPSLAGDRAGAERTEFDPRVLHEWLDADHLSLRREVLALVASRVLAPRVEDEEDTHAYRERTLERCRVLAGHGLGALGYPEEFGGRNDIGGAIAAFETLAYGDLSLLVKFGVHFGLFGGSILQLGTRVHHERWLRAVGTLELPGCFAMTETGHGSNVRDIRTTATWDAASAGFIIHSPDRDAWKDYIGNAAQHGQVATVFAQLYTDGALRGVHAFVVPIRDQAGHILPGITIEDCGHKHGLNGVDNGRIAFDHVRIPRDHLLDRFGGVDENGAYASSIASPTRRFFTMLGTLVAGRISIAAGSLSAAKTGLAIAVRYAAQRRQFGPEGGPEVPILDYLTMQRRLLPRIAEAIALDCALNDLVRTYAGDSGVSNQEIEALAAGFKAHASAFAVQTLHDCRQACGGQGYLSASRLPALIADTDIFTTFEGANTVLLQLVTKGLLSGYREQFGELSLWGVVRWVGGRAAAAVTELNPVITRRTAAAHLRDSAFHLAALRWREDRLLGTLARRLKRRIDAGEDSFSALNACQDHAVALARAHVDRLVLERLHDAVARCDSDALRPILDLAAALHGLARIDADRGWFLEKGYLEAAKARAVRDEVNTLCGELRPHAVALVNGFGIPAELLPEIAH